jgi:uroporphyrinogen-III synthase
LHLRGREARGAVTERLTAAGVACEAAVVYEQLDLPLPDTARHLLTRSAPVLLPLFSPNSAARLAVATAGIAVAAPLLVAAMSPAVAAGWSGSRPARIAVADRPEAQAMLDALETLLEVSLRR